MSFKYLDDVISVDFDDKDNPTFAWGSERYEYDDEQADEVEDSIVSEIDRWRALKRREHARMPLLTCRIRISSRRTNGRARPHRSRRTQRQGCRRGPPRLGDSDPEPADAVVALSGHARAA